MFSGEVFYPVGCYISHVFLLHVAGKQNIKCTITPNSPVLPKPSMSTVLCWNKSCQFEYNMDLKLSSLTQGVVNVSLIRIFIDAAKHLVS